MRCEKQDDVIETFIGEKCLGEASIAGKHQLPSGKGKVRVG